MARVWRFGQTKPVFIYRLVSDDVIENAILLRQKGKDSLSSGIFGSEVITQLESEEDQSNQSAAPSLSKKDLILLIHPKPTVSNRGRDRVMDRKAHTGHEAGVDEDEDDHPAKGDEVLLDVLRDIRAAGNVSLFFY